MQSMQGVVPPSPSDSTPPLTLNIRNVRTHEALVLDQRGQVGGRRRPASEPPPY